MLLDLYPAGPLKECSYKAGEDLLAAAPYFDAGPYKASPYDLCPGVVITGGMRERIFYTDRNPTGLGAKIRDTVLNLTHRVPLLRNTPRVRARRQRSPCLTKVPLIRWDRQSQYVYSTHFVSHRIVAPDTGVLLHFKFLHDFHGRSTLEAARGEYHEGASEYLRYAEILRKNPDMSLSCEASARFEGTLQLVRLGLMRETEAWAAAKANSSE
jgi:hypothetical protein